MASLKRLRASVGLVVFLNGLFSPSVALAQDCPASGPPTSTPPTARLVVSVISIKPNSDLEGDDDYVPFYDNHADIYGTVIIDGQEFELPKVNESDFPHWGENGRFVKQLAGPGLIPISFKIAESDHLITGSDDTVDVSPTANKDRLDVFLDTCDMKIKGEASGAAGHVVSVKAGNDSDDATIVFKVEMEDGRPLTKGDVALAQFDLIQVLPDVTTMVANKPTVGLVRVANNSDVAQAVSVHVIVKAGATTLKDEIISVGTLGAGEVKKQYLFENSPVLFPIQYKPYTATATLQLVHSNTQELGVKCLMSNDFSSVLSWRVVTATEPSHLWVRTGALLDATDYASKTELKTIRDLAIPFINGVYPVAKTTHDTLPIPFFPPLAGLSDALLSVASALGIPADSLLPVMLVMDLNGLAVMTLNDRVMGVLEPKWFQRFSYGLWDDVTGFSLGQFAPRGVIFQSGDLASAAPTLPAHELGHTYGLSMDPTIKDPWACNWTPPLGVIACGLTGGFDEYKSSDHPDGINTWGYWYPQGPSSPEMLPVTGEQCSSHCMMGPSPSAAQNSWGSNKKWIDSADYDQLLRQLAISGSFSSLMASAPVRHMFISGMVLENKSAYLGTAFALPALASKLDFTRNDEKDLFAIRFFDAAGALVGENTLPLDWNRGDFKGKLPVTFFAGTIALPNGTTSIQVWDRQVKKQLATREVSASSPVLTAPTVSVATQSGTLRALHIAWKATDAEKGALTHTAMIRSSKATTWWPLAYEQKDSKVSTEIDLAAGTYSLRVISNDGVNIGVQDTTFTVAK